MKLTQAHVGQKFYDNFLMRPVRLVALSADGQTAFVDQQPDAEGIRSRAKFYVQVPVTRLFRLTERRAAR